MNRVMEWLGRPTSGSLESRRAGDTWRGRISWLWTRMIPLIAVIIAAYSVIEVQNQRRDAIRIQCQDQNARHVAAEKGLIGDPLFKPKKHQTAAQELQRQRVSTQFVQLMIPKRDCDKVVEQLAP